MASSKRERELARMRAERQAARKVAAQAARAKRRNAMLAGVSALAVAAVVVGIAITTKDDGSKTSTLAGPVCSYKSGGEASKKVTGLPATSGPAVKGPTPLTLTTNRGEIALKLDGEGAPCTTNSVTFLAAQKYFDNTQCHRLTTSGIFVLQCGDPSGSGSGGPGYSFADENLASLGTGTSVVYKRGTLAMANAGPGTNGSQFFLVYKDSTLPPNYTPFGTIEKGLELLDSVAKGGSTPVDDGKPNTAVTITKAA